MEYKAVLIGATGLVGQHLLDYLLQHPSYSSVLVMHRRTTGVTHPKLKEEIINFDEPELWKHLVSGDHLYSALGTTIKAAGSKEAQYKVDVHYPIVVAQVAKANGITHHALVSSIGANAKSNSFYPRIKGELEDMVMALGFESCSIFRPSFLVGDRDEFRLGEKIGIPIAQVLCKLPGLKAYHPVQASKVAQVMVDITASSSKHEPRILESKEIRSFST
ncbi:NAD-dependent epimerase/dehydratase family protein [Balneola vulgaris]|uniref:NAD-dependent epimerase/dehydratase family protein n=1 Tax=Balneola vulgaris TaxID=287535 RepID=UPI0003629B95|nr:NAD-dependent epimerase/dehydratase family protein [Balneola vulgaris]